MNVRSLTFALVAAGLCLTNLGCMNAPGKPKLEVEGARPEQILDFPTLYKQNCAACHGEDGKSGVAIALANPVYLATAGIDNVQRITATGVHGTMMPPFGKRAGGMLTDAQIAALAHGIFDAWGRSNALAGVTPLPYASQGQGDSVRGQVAFATFCASCHGVDGTGLGAQKSGRSGSTWTLRILRW
jgi:mono/diheme cytochrome c family protein